MRTWCLPALKQNDFRCLKKPRLRSLKEGERSVQTMFQFCSISLLIQLASAETNSWEKLSPNGSLPTSRYTHSAVWVDDLRGMLVFGGQIRDDYRQMNDLHLYRSETNSWEELTPSGSLPPALEFPSAVWSNDLKGMLIFGGWLGNDLHLYRSQTNSWEKLSPNGSLPTSRYKHSAVWVDDLRGMLVFGGQIRDDYRQMNDLHLYRSETNSWEELTPSGSLPPALELPSAVWSNDLKGMLIFGGWLGNDLHLYRSQTNSWEKLSPSGSLPTSRYKHSAVWVDDLRGMLVFGGQIRDDYRQMNDLHLYRSETNSWEELTPSGSLPPALELPSAVWSNDLKGMLIFGGWLGNDLHLYHPMTTTTVTSSTGTTRTVTSSTFTTRTATVTSSTRTTRTVTSSTFTTRTATVTSSTGTTRTVTSSTFTTSTATLPASSTVTTRISQWYLLSALLGYCWISQIPS